MQTIKKDRLKKKPKDIEYAQNERHIMSSFKHPFIVHLRYAFQSSTELFYVMEYVPGGEIFTRLGRVGTLPEASVKFYTSEILLALDYLHSNNIIYRDLKPDNILIHKDGHIKLADFGLCKILKASCWSSCSDTSPDEDEECAKNGYHRRLEVPEIATESECATTRSCCGTLVYMAPEVVEKQAYGRSADFWSLGVVVYDMLVGHPPFHVEKRRKKRGHGLRRGSTTDRLATRYNILHCNYRVPDCLTDDAKSFIAGLLRLDVNQRLGGFSANADQIKSHQFLIDMDWKSMLQREVQPPFVPQIKSYCDVSHFQEEHTSDVSEVGKVIDAASFDQDLPDAQSFHINNFDYTSPDVFSTSSSWSKPTIYYFIVHILLSYYQWLWQRLENKGYFCKTLFDTIKHCSTDKLLEIKSRAKINCLLRKPYGNTLYNTGKFDLLPPMQ